MIYHSIQRHLLHWCGWACRLLQVQSAPDKRRFANTCGAQDGNRHFYRRWIDADLYRNNEPWLMKGIIKRLSPDCRLGQRLVPRDLALTVLEGWQGRKTCDCCGPWPGCGQPSSQTDVCSWPDTSTSWSFVLELCPLARTSVSSFRPFAMRDSDRFRSLNDERLPDRVAFNGPPDNFEVRASWGDSPYDLVFFDLRWSITMVHCPSAPGPRDYSDRGPSVVHCAWTSNGCRPQRRRDSSLYRTCQRSGPANDSNPPKVFSDAPGLSPPVGGRGIVRLEICVYYLLLWTHGNSSTSGLTTSCTCMCKVFKLQCWLQHLNPSKTHPNNNILMLKSQLNT